MKSRKEKIENARKYIEEWEVLQLNVLDETVDDLIREFLIEDFKNYNKDNLFKSYIKYIFESYRAKYDEAMFASGREIASNFLVTRQRRYDEENAIPLEDMKFYNFKNKIVSERVKKIY